MAAAAACMYKAGQYDRRLWLLRLTAAILVVQIRGEDASSGLSGFDSLLSDTVRMGQASKVPALVILGDSTVDVGVNNHLITAVRSDHAPYGRDFPTKKPTGRFCNGKLINDFLAEHMGLPYPLAYLDPKAKGNVILQGINVASSGSGYFDLTAIDLNVKTVSQQVDWIKNWQKEVAEIVGNDTAATITSEAVYIISTGSNDWVNNYYTTPFLKLVFNTTQFTDHLLGLVRLRIQDLYDLGARKIAIVSLPPLGCIPEVITAHGGGKECIPFIETDSAAFNEGLQGVISYMQGVLPGNKIVYLDAYTLIHDAFDNPSKYGIKSTETFRGCCGTGLFETGPFCNQLTKACKDADQYLFWDSFHPTQFFNKLAAEIFYKVMSPAMGLE